MTAEQVRALRGSARGYCQCAGECGENHNWLPTDPPRPCRASHGTRIVRKKDNPSFWQAVRGTLERPEMPELGPELYATKIVTVSLDPANVSGDKVIAACQRCRKKLERRDEP